MPQVRHRGAYPIRQAPEKETLEQSVCAFATTNTDKHQCALPTGCADKFNMDRILLQGAAPSLLPQFRACPDDLEPTTILVEQVASASASIWNVYFKDDCRPMRGPDLQGAEPPHVRFLADARSKPECADVKKFFGNKVFENLQQRAQHHGKTHPQVAPFGREGSLWAVVYTDGTPSRQKSPLSPDGERGMWFPTLVVQTRDGRWGAWCFDAAVNNWTK